jgi:hypothetical protein
LDHARQRFLLFIRNDCAKPQVGVCEDGTEKPEFCFVLCIFEKYNASIQHNEYINATARPQQRRGKQKINKSKYVETSGELGSTKKNEKFVKHQTMNSNSHRRELEDSGEQQQTVKLRNAT